MATLKGSLRKVVGDTLPSCHLSESAEPSSFSPSLPGFEPTAKLLFESGCIH